VPTGLASAKPTFERTSYLWDLLRCQRFLPVFGPVASAAAFINVGQNISTTQALVFYQFPVIARAPITGIIVSAPGNFQLSDASGANIACTAAIFNVGADGGCDMKFTVASGLVAGNATFGFVFTGSALTGAPQIIFTGAEI
jgi:hypothetical protein